MIFIQGHAMNPHTQSDKHLNLNQGSSTLGTCSQTTTKPPNHQYKTKSRQDSTAADSRGKQVCIRNKIKSQHAGHFKYFKELQLNIYVRFNIQDLLGILS
jgi:hypothetical protein